MRLQVLIDWKYTRRRVYRIAMNATGVLHGTPPFAPGTAVLTVTNSTGWNGAGESTF